MPRHAIQDPPHSEQPGRQLLVLTGTPGAHSESNTDPPSPTDRPSLHAARELNSVRTACAESGQRLSRTLQELATDLAISRRECRDQRDEIDALTLEIARLNNFATDAAADRDAADHAAGGRGDQPGAHRTHRTQHEHALEWMSSALLVLRRGNLALKQENASLRLELERIRDSHYKRSEATARSEVRG